jgi:hypothetical protein
VSTNRRFEVISKIFGKGIFTLDLEMDWTFEVLPDIADVDNPHSGYAGTWRILSAGCPAKWHKDQAEDARHPGTDSYILEDESDEDTAEQPAKPFETPSGKWLTIVTDIGEVLGFEIVRELP